LVIKKKRTVNYGSNYTTKESIWNKKIGSVKGIAKGTAKAGKWGARKGWGAGKYVANKYDWEKEKKQVKSIGRGVSTATKWGANKVKQAQINKQNARQQALQQAEQQKQTQKQNEQQQNQKMVNNLRKLYSKKANQLQTISKEINNYMKQYNHLKQEYSKFSGSGTPTGPIEKQLKKVQIILKDLESKDKTLRGELEEIKYRIKKYQ